MQMWPMRSGTLMYRGGWTNMMKWVCTLIFLVACKVTLVNGLTPCQGAWISRWMSCLGAWTATFGSVRDYDSMIQPLYEIRQKEHETVEEYMLRVHEVVAVVKCAYPDQVPNEGESLRRDRFYYGLIPSLRDMLSFTMANLPERENKQTLALTLSTIWPRNWRCAINHEMWSEEELHSWPS